MNEKELLDLVKEVNKELKTDSVIVAGLSKSLDLPRQRFGTLSYDIVSGGGAPKGRNICIFGPESSGKTTASLMMMARYCRDNEDKRAMLFIDAEYAFDKKYATALGVDMNRLIIIQPDHIAQAAPVLKTLLEKNAIGLFVVDSIAALKPLSVIENETDASNIGKHAQAIGNMYVQVNGLVGKNFVTGVWINQIRDSIGGYGGGISLPGGHAPKFYSSIMFQVNRGSKVKNDDGTFLNRGLVRTTKNKTAPPYQESEYDMEHGTGISLAQEVRDFGVETGVLYKKGHAYYYDSEFKNNPEKSKDHTLIGKGKEDAKQFLKENVDLTEELAELILKAKIN